jgi:hypothetical protein
MEEQLEASEEIEMIESITDEDLERMVYGTSGCSVGSVPNTCQMQSNKF